MTDVPTASDPKDLLAIGLESASPGSRPGWTPPAPGDLPAIPNLEIGPLLGCGGMGAVYRARQTHLDRPVALKILDPARGADPAFAERFAREARAMARLDHPAIVRLYDYGQTGTWPWLVMELVEGANLREVIRTGNLSAAEALRIAPQLCEALAHAHAAGVVHRDLKPENILIDGRGRPHIADFGLAKLADAGGSLTATGQGCGTAVYMAPEQVAGAADVDHRADLYAFGVILYEMLTGNLPLGRFAPPSQTTGVDKRLDEVVLKSLEREPGRRWQTADEVRQAVESVTGEADPRSAANRDDQDQVRIDIGWRGIHLETGPKRVVLDGDGDVIEPKRPGPGKLHRTGLLFLIGGVLFMTWLVVGEHTGSPAMQRLAWCSAGGLVAGGMSLLLRAWLPLAIVGGIAALLAIPCVWPLATGFWATCAVIVLALVGIHHVWRAFDLRKLERHYLRTRSAESRTAEAHMTAWEAVAMVAACLAVPLMLWIQNGMPLPRPAGPGPTSEVEPSVRRIFASSAGRIQLAAYHGGALPVGRTWHLRSRIRWHDVQGQAMLESVQRFADGGAYFSRTLADRGPMASFTGSSDAWRDVVLPFDASATTSALTAIEATLVMAGPGTVELEPFSLVEGLPR